MRRSTSLPQKALAVLTSVAMVVGLVPAPALAEIARGVVD